jgi:outer membrane protein OmpA-like peptidoglycan-associated protein
MKQLLITVMTLLVMSNVVSAQQSRSDEKLEFRPNWGLKVQGGASFTIGEADFSKLLSPAAQLSATYNFHHAMGVRFGFSGWEGKGTVVVTDEMYSFRFLQLNADYVLDLASLFGGFKHDRIWTPYVFAGIGGAYGFDNKEAGKYVAEFGDVVSRYWETAPFFVVRAGLGVDFWVAKNVALGLEANANGYSDKFNSKGAVSGFNPDFQFNALLGLKFRFGGNTRPSKAYADKVAAEEAAEAARLAAEKAAAEKAAAEKAAAEKAAAEKAAAEKAAAEKAAAERARICAEQSTNVFFTIGSYSIRKSEMPKIDKLVEFLKANPDYSVSLVGYADKATGTSARNLAISKERVNAVKAKMIQLGAPADRIETDYVGDTVQPYIENDQNRVIICTVK